VAADAVAGGGGGGGVAFDRLGLAALAGLAAAGLALWPARRRSRARAGTDREPAAAPGG
jgi:hypothetical protein